MVSGAGGIAVPWLYILFVDILLMGMCNAVNLTDGLDGLAAGTVMIVMIVMAAIAYRSDVLDSGHLRRRARRRLRRASSGSTRYPADIFMGDTGSLALGMALGCLAVVTKTEFVVAHHRRPVRGRGPVGHDPGVLLQEDP